MVLNNCGIMGSLAGVLYYYYGHSAVSGLRGHSNLLPGWYRLYIDVGGASCVSR